jgi:hypothetical protein
VANFKALSRRGCRNSQVGTDPVLADFEEARGGNTIEYKLRDERV